MTRAAFLPNRFVPRFETLEGRTLLSTCHVTRLGDIGRGDGSHGDLRYCIAKVESEPGPDEIDFAVTGMINLKRPLPVLRSEVDIIGPAADLLTVRRDENAGTHFRIFYVASAVEISGLTISNGSAFSNFPNSSFGGGILNDATLTLRRCVISGNQASSGNVAYGGGIHNNGRLTIIDTSVRLNRAYGLESLGGGISNQGSASILSSTIDENEANYEAPGSGGGIYNAGTMTLRNSTIALNRAASFGGGIYAVNGLTEISHSTISANSSFEGGGGLFFPKATNVSIRNTILAGNFLTPGFSADDISGKLTGSGYNLIGTTAHGSGFATTDILNVDAKLSRLADNGGPTMTMELLPDSPAIDAGDNTGAPEFDQRGPGFPRIGNGTIDIGAFEVQVTRAQGVNPVFMVTADSEED